MFPDPDQQDLVIGATVKEPAEDARSSWKLSGEDCQTLQRLLGKYEELMVMYDGWSPTERVEDWDKSLICYQAVFCQNTMYRMQGLLANHANTVKKTEAQPYRLPNKASAFENGTKDIVKRIATEADLMWGWWINKAPSKPRERELM